MQPTCSDIPCLVEIVEAAFDWTGWLRGLGCEWHGHTPNAHTKAREEGVVRVLRFMKRRKLAPELEVDSAFPEAPLGRTSYCW